MTDPTPEVRAAAKAFARARATLTLDGLKSALTSVYGDGWQTGAMVAVQQTGATVASGITGVAVPTTDAEWGKFWDDWQPGNQAAADQLASSGGLSTLLDQADTTITSIGDTTLDQLGSRLAQGVANGDSIDTIADSLSGYVDDPDRAFQIADTEVARAVNASSLDQYAAQDVAQVEWLVSPDACDECQDNADASPYALDDFPDLPAHPECRCSSSPLDPGA